MDHQFCTQAVPVDALTAGWIEPAQEPKVGKQSKNFVTDMVHHDVSQKAGACIYFSQKQESKPDSLSFGPRIAVPNIAYVWQSRDAGP